MNVSEQRNRALAVLEKEKDENGYSPIDYAIDDECRRVFKLPSRPNNDSPYVGWMMLKPATKESTGFVSGKGIDLIKRWEGCKFHAYLCPAKVWTIGYGHTKTAKYGMKVTKEEAESLLKEDVRVYEKAVRVYVRVPLTQGQFDALVSFTFNVGVNAFKKSTLLRILNEGRYKTAALQLHRWVNGGGKKLPGLVNRRNDEYDLFVGE